MSTGPSKSILSTHLGGIPQQFRDPILLNYAHLKKRYRAGDFSGVGPAVTQFCEDVLRWLQEVILGTGKSTPAGVHIANFPGECDTIERQPKGAHDEALKVLIPRALKFIHSIRSKRGLVHTPGTVSANLIDLATIARVADWVMAELLRTYGKMDLGTAQALIDSLSYRELPDLWRINGKTRVLKSGLPFRDKVLLIASDAGGEAVLVDDLLASVEHSNGSVFRSKVLKKLHDDGLIEFDRESDSVTISPTGSAEVEDRIAPPV